MSSSPAKVKANRANAQLSTGPQSPHGKAKSSLNAVKTGLTGRTVLLNTDDAAAYEAHVKRFSDQYAPSTDEERALTYQLAETEWRLLRIPTLEAGNLCARPPRVQRKFRKRRSRRRDGLVSNASHKHRYCCSRRLLFRVPSRISSLRRVMALLPWNSRRSSPKIVKSNWT